MLGLGAANLIDVAVDLDARQDVGELRRLLEGYRQERRPVVAVVAVIGTTEEDAVDPLADILQVRDDFARQGRCSTCTRMPPGGGITARC